jgi:hypothetical protein
VSAGAGGGWAGHSPGGCGGAGGRTRGRGGPRAAGGTPALPGGSTLPVPATKIIIHTCFYHSLIKKKIKFSSCVRKLRMEQLQSHILITNDLLINGEIFAHLPFLIFDFATAPL